MSEILVSGDDLSLADVRRVLSEPRPMARLSSEATRRLAVSRAAVERIIAGPDAVYGVNTGLGRLCEVKVSEEQLAALQVNLIRSHAAGTGPLLPAPESRLALLLRANALATGRSGVRPEVVTALLAAFNAGLAPAVPEQGSVGASGDLAPLAHIALALLGEGAFLDASGKAVPAGPALAAAGLAPLELGVKDGISLVNGTQVSTAILATALMRVLDRLRIADVALALTLEGLLGSVRPFDARIHEARPHPGQAVVATNLRRLLTGSEVIASHQGCGRVQDAYSLRCAPQIHGAARDAIGYVRGVVERELNAATDNPLVFAEDGLVLPGGNFHGQPLGIAADVLALAIVPVATVSERRTDRLLNPDLSGLPAFLVPEWAGLRSGFMMAQVTAAALASEMKVHAHPASSVTIPTGAGKEDHVSMSTAAAVKARRATDALERVLAIELLCGAQALEFHRPLRSGPRVEAVVARLRQTIPRLTDDRPLAPDIEAARLLIADGSLLDAAGELG